MALTDASVAIEARVIAREVTTSITLTAVARTTHHIFSKSATLLDRSLQVLVCLLLDRLGVL